MIRRSIITAMVAVVITAGAAMGIIIASGWTDTHSTTGIVNASTVPDLLMICQPTGPNPDPCPSDNSGADETIFPLTEGLLPGGPSAEQLVRLVNVRSHVQWDVSAVN